MRTNRVKLPRKRQARIKQLYQYLRSDNGSQLAEAVTSFNRYDDAPVKPILRVLKTAADADNREHAAYILISFLLRAEVNRTERSGFVGRRNSISEAANQRRKTAETILKALIETVVSDENPLVRAQALETLGMSLTARKPKHKLHDKIEKAVLSAFDDESEEVRFWACYAAGQLGMKNAVPQLRRLAENDKALARMWYVAEEASDAIKWIYDIPTKSRKPVGSRKNKSFIRYYFEKTREMRATKRRKCLV